MSYGVRRAKHFPLGLQAFCLGLYVWLQLWSSSPAPGWICCLLMKAQAHPVSSRSQSETVIPTLPHLLPSSSEISDSERLFDLASSCSSLPYPPRQSLLSPSCFLSIVEHFQLQRVAVLQTRQICLSLLKNVKDLPGVNYITLCCNEKRSGGEVIVLFW